MERFQWLDPGWRGAAQRCKDITGKAPESVTQRGVRGLGGDRGLNAAVLPPVGKVHDQAYYQPDDEPRPVDPSEFGHHVSVEQNAQHRDQTDPWRADGAL